MFPGNLGGYYTEGCSPFSIVNGIAFVGPGVGFCGFWNLKCFQVGVSGIPGSDGACLENYPFKHLFGSNTLNRLVSFYFSFIMTTF